VAALSTPDPRSDANVHPAADRLRLIRELGSSAIPIFGASERRPDGTSRLVVVERVLKRRFEDVEISAWIQDARRLMALDHPNVVRVRDVITRGDEVCVITDFIDGVRWTELALGGADTGVADAQRPPLEAALRLFLDALSGLNALHNLRDAKRQPLKLVHGGLTPGSILLGSDGVARIAGASRLRSAAARLPGSGSAYLAPEVLLEDDTADARADVYSIGVMLWEVLSERSFLPSLQPSAIVTHLLSGRLPAVTIPSSIPWAAPLAEVVTRALSADPEKRFASASTMAAELRRIAGPRLPTAARMASLVRDAFGESIRARREGLERGERRSKAPLRSMAAPRDLPEEAFDIDMDEETAEASSTAPTLPPPAPEPESTTHSAPSPSVPMTPAAPMTTIAAMAPDAPMAPVAPTAPTMTMAAMAPTMAAAARESDAAAEMTPMAIATPLASAERDSRSPRRRPKAWLFPAVGVATIALAAVCWLGVRTRDPLPLPRPVDPIAVVRPPAPSVPLPSPQPPSVQADAPPADRTESAEPPSPPSPDEALSSAPAVPAHEATKTPLRPSSHLRSVPAKTRPSSTRRAYDPQGI
jgi:hypothetical protein